MSIDDWNSILHHGDCLEVLQSFPDGSVDAVVTDPPYGLSFMGKKWDYDVPSEAIWRECLRVLKPGGHLLAFAGTRTQHRMAVRIEDAGFEIRDMIAWVYGSGFPKSLNVSKQIDGKDGRLGWKSPNSGKYGGDGNGMCRPGTKRMPNVDVEIESNAAREWAGWGTALKPALEPITVARKPLAGTVAANVQAHGTGALNIDASRIMPADQERDADAYKRLSFLGSASCIRGFSLAQLRGYLLRIASALRAYSTDDICHLHNAGGSDGSQIDHALCERLVARLFPNGVWCGGSSWSVPDSLCGCQFCRRSCDEHIRLLRDAARDGAPSLADALEHICLGRFGLEHSHGCQCSDRLSNSGDFLPAWSFAFLVGEYCTLYSAPPQSQGRWPANLIHDGSGEVVGLFPAAPSRGEYTKSLQKPEGKKQIFGSVIGSQDRDNRYAGETGSAARFFYCAKASKRDRDEGNHHPTVKPTDLMRYLCRLVTPPGGVVLDPFMGSGSTGKACALEGFQFIGIEREAEYVEIARARIAAVTKTQQEALFA